MYFNYYVLFCSKRIPKLVLCYHETIFNKIGSIPLGVTLYVCLSSYIVL